MPYRILHLLTLAGLGGMESSLLPIIRGMDPGRFHSEIAVLREQGPMSGHWNRAGITVTHLGIRRDGSPATLLKLARFIRTGGYDVVTLYGVAVNILGRIACRLAGRPGVVGVIRGFSNERRISRTRLWLDRMTFPLADCYVSNSRAVIEHLREAGFPPKKLKLAPTGISTEPFDRAPPREEAQRRIGLADVSRPVITCLGNLRPVKNHGLLLNACRLLKDREIEFLLLLAGAGPDEQRLRREVEELSLTDRVRFLGEREDIPAVLAASDLFVLSSLWEGLPRSIMEAMAARLAVVSTDAGGVKELVVEGETGYVVPVGSAESLADRMGELLSDGPLRDGMGEAGYRRVREHFTDERMVRSIEAVYEEVLRFRAGDG